MNTRRWGLVAVVAVVLALVGALGASPVLGGQGGENGKARAASAQGVVNIDGQDVIVEVVVAVGPGENPRAAARAALRRAYPNARPIDSTEFSTSGLLWDIFFDGDPGNDNVVVNYNGKDVPGNLANDHRATWVASMTEWNDVPTSVFVFADGGDTGRCASLVQECKGRQKFDGNNDVMWIDIKDPSILGVTWYGLSIDEFDMALDNKNFTWYNGLDPALIPPGAFDVQTVWTHEKGHGLGLGHSDVDGAVMETFYEGPRRDLHQDDIDGITFLYPDGGGEEAPPPPPPPPPEGGVLSVSVSTDKTSYVNRENVQITVTITDGSNPVGGAAVHVDLTTADGNKLVADGTTNNDGVAKFKYKVNSKRHGVGTYAVDATASKAGFESGGGSTTFEVTK